MSPANRTQLEAIIAHRNSIAKHILRAKIVLATAASSVRCCLEEVLRRCSVIGGCGHWLTSVR